MNTLKKAYCRVFQQAFHIAIPFLPYRKPKRLFHMEELAALLEKKKISSVLLVTDSFIHSSGLTKNLEQELADKNIFCAISSAPFLFSLFDSIFVHIALLSADT